MGYWPSKLIAVLNIILMVGYGVISCIIGGQILSAVSGGSLSVVLGIVIIALISWIIAVFGMTPFHVYERYVLCFASKVPRALVQSSCKIMPRTVLTPQQMGMDTPNPRPLHPHWLRRSALQHKPPINGQQRHHCRKPPLLLRSPTLSPRILDRRRLRFLCLLPGAHREMESLPNDLHRPQPLLHLRQPPRSRSRKRRKQQRKLGHRLHNLIRSTHTRRLRRAGRLRETLRRHHCIGTVFEQRARHLRRRTGFPDPGQAVESRAPLLLGHGRGHHLLRLRRRGPRPPLPHLPELPRVDGLLGRHLRHHCSRRAHHIQKP